MRKTKIWLPLLCAALLLPAAARLHAQTADTGKIHGHVQDPAGTPLKDGTVVLSEDGGRTAKYTFKTDDNGNYTGENIAPGTYTFIYRNPDTPPDKVVDEINEVKIVAGQDTLQDDDMTRPAYIEKMSPEQRKEMEAVKAKNASVLKENAQIKNLNADLLEARADNRLGKDGTCIDSQNRPIYGKADAAACTAAGGKPNNPADDYQKAAAIMTTATAAKPDAGVLWLELGIAQKGLGKYDDAVASLKKTLELDSKKPNPEIEASANDALGETYVTMGKIPEAQAAYDAAAQAATQIDPKSPKNAAQYYTNEAIMMDRVNNIDGTVAAADKAIAADPTKPIPYYLKGKALINRATVDPKTQKIVAPPGCAEAYQKYLELAPTGPFANDAKSVLAEMGTTISSSYKASKKK